MSNNLINNQNYAMTGGVTPAELSAAINSAVNGLQTQISAIKENQETVLWTGSQSSGDFNFSEPCTNFRWLRIAVFDEMKCPGAVVSTTMRTKGWMDIPITTFTTDNDGKPVSLMVSMYRCALYQDKLTVLAQNSCFWITTNGITATSPYNIVQISGIERISG